MTKRFVLKGFIAGCCLVVGAVTAVGCETKKSDSSETSPTQSATSTPAEAPKIQVDNPSHDFGTIVEGDVVKHTFVIKNTGNAPLKIDKVRASCGCTAAVTKEKEVPPGGTTELEVQFDSKNRFGKDSKTVQVHSNDPENPVLPLTFTSNIEKYLAFEPALVRLETAYGGPISEEVWLVGKVADETKIEVQKPVDPASTVKMEMITKEVDGKKITGVRFSTTGKTVVNHSGQVEFKTDNEKRPTVRIPYRVAVTGNVRVSPKRLYFDESEGSATSRVVTVSSKRDDFKVKKATVVKGPYKVSIEPNKGSTFRINVERDKNKEPKKGANDKKKELGQTEVADGAVELVTNDPIEPKIRIEIQKRDLSVVRGPLMHQLAGAQQGVRRIAEERIPINVERSADPEPVKPPAPQK